MSKEVKKIAEIIECYIQGDWGQAEQTSAENKQVYCVRGADIEAINAGTYENVPLRFVEESSFVTRNLSAGDIIIEKSGGSTNQSTGRVAYISRQLANSMKDIVCSNFCSAFRTKAKYSSRFIYYYLQFLYKMGVFFNFEGKTSGIKNLLLEQAFSSLDIVLPKRERQDKAADVLSWIDEKIELNRKINAELESLIQLIYDYWFLQFEFSNADGKPYCRSGGKMVYNTELKREIPAKWEVRAIGEVCKTVLGGTPSTKVEEYWNGGTIAWLSSGEIANFPIFDAEGRITEAGVENSATEILPKGTVMLSITRHLRPSILAINACANQSVVGIKESDKLKYYYLYPFFKKEIPRLEAMRTGAQQPHINKNIVDATLVLIPPSDILEKYYNAVAELYNQIINHAKQNIELDALRGFLLPLLMNGQVTVEGIA